MQSYISTVIIFFVSLTSFTAFSQHLTSAEVNSKISKSWTATEVGNTGKDLKPKKNKEIMIFKSDGSLTIIQYSSMMGNTTSEVKWGFDEEKQKIIMTLPMGGLSESQELDILELTDEKLVLMSPEKQTVYIPTKNTIEEASKGTAANPGEEITSEGLNPEAWSGALHYNIVIMADVNDDTGKEKVPGVITLEKLGERKIIKKIELGSTVTWTINSTSNIANITRYDAVCTDLNLNGEISFQNGFMLLEIYEPKYLSYLWAVE